MAARPSDPSHANLLDDLRWRGLLHQSTEEASLEDHLATPGRRVYCGFDPTADSLTVGNLLPITLLARVRAAGHVPVVLFGGATGQIGDPSFKSDERVLLDPDVAAANVARHRATIGAVLDSVDGPDPIFVDNLDWFGSMPVLEFLREVGKSFSVNELLRRDAVRSRIEGREQGLSFTEFSYALLQAYDFLHLFERDAVTVQFGASDQWGNIVGGADLIRRRHGGGAHAFTCPLLLKKDGAKFGKSEGGAVWLAADRTSPYAFYQFLVNLDDELTPTFVRFFSLAPRGAIEALLTEHDADPGRRSAQRAVAAELTARVHGPDALDRVQHTSAALFSGDVASLDLDQIDDAMADVPSVTITRDQLRGGLDVVDVLLGCGLAASRSRARQFVSDGAVAVNGARVTGERPLDVGDLLHDRVLLVRRGKRNWGVVRLAD